MTVSLRGMYRKAPTCDEVHNTMANSDESAPSVTVQYWRYDGLSSPLLLTEWFYWSVFEGRAASWTITNRQARGEITQDFPGHFTLKFIFHVFSTHGGWFSRFSRTCGAAKLSIVKLTKLCTYSLVGGMWSTTTKPLWLYCSSHTCRLIHMDCAAGQEVSCYCS